MHHPAIVELFHYWNRLRGAKSAPSRNSIEPGDIRKILPDLFILEKTAGGEILFRLAGTRICTLFDFEFRGSEFAEAFDDDSGEAITSVATDVMNTAQSRLLSATTFRRDGTGMEAEILLLPLASEGHTVDRAIGALAIKNLPASHIAGPVAKLTLQNSRILVGDQLPLLGETGFQHHDNTDAFPNEKGALGTIAQKVMHLRVFEGGISD